MVFKFKKMMNNYEKELQKIENKHKFIKSKLTREMAIWEEIATYINEYKGKERKYWGNVMDLFRLKYR
jgi:hypothetical protein